MQHIKPGESFLLPPVRKSIRVRAGHYYCSCSCRRKWSWITKIHRARLTIVPDIKMILILYHIPLSPLFCSLSREEGRQHKKTLCKICTGGQSVLALKAEAMDMVTGDDIPWVLFAHFQRMGGRGERRGEINKLTPLPYTPRCSQRQFMSSEKGGGQGQ